MHHDILIACQRIINEIIRSCEILRDLCVVFVRYVYFQVLNEWEFFGGIANRKYVFNVTLNLWFINTFF